MIIQLGNFKNKFFSLYFWLTKAEIQILTKTSDDNK